MHHIFLMRADNLEGFLSTNSIGTDALNALVAIQGVSCPEIVKVTDGVAELTYKWNGEERFMRADEHFNKYGLVRVYSTT